MTAQALQSALRATATRLTLACAGSCTCGTKTPEINFHDEQCHYRLFAEAAADLYQAARALSNETPEDKHRFGSPPEPVVNPSEAWLDAYADWYHQGKG